jgi:serine/threonine-protein kinase PRP4
MKRKIEGVKDQPGVKKVQQVVDDDDDDDMFSDSFKVKDNGTAHKLTAAADVNFKVADEVLDDSEGYYRVNPGDVIDGRFRVTAFLGKGVFASVARATVLPGSNLAVLQDADYSNKGRGDGEEREGMGMGMGMVVAVKIIRNNSVMFKAGQKEVATLLKLQEIEKDRKRSCIINLLESFEYKKHLCLVFENMRFV